MIKKTLKGIRLAGASRFDSVIKSIRKAFSRQISKVGYDFWDEMMKNDVAVSSRPDIAATKWYKANFRNNKDTWLKGGLMKPGRLYMFDYKDPLTRSTLPWFDTNPLVLSLGPYRTKEGKIRNIGINMHLMPPKIRRLVMFTIFSTFKTQYKKNLYASDPKDIPAIKWKTIQNLVAKYGTGFAIRMYIPQRQKHIIEFPVEEMPKAIWIPSARYEKTNAAKLEKEWRAYLSKHRRIARNVMNESHTSSV